MNMVKIHKHNINSILISTEKKYKHKEARNKIKTIFNAFKLLRIENISDTITYELCVYLNYLHLF